MNLSAVAWYSGDIVPLGSGPSPEPTGDARDSGTSSQQSISGREEQLVDTSVVGELGMEGRHQHVTLAAQDRLVAHRGEDLDVGAGLVDDRRPDEHRGERLVETGDVEVGFEGVTLATERVASHGQIDRTEAVPDRADRRGSPGPAGSCRRRSRTPAWRRPGAGPMGHGARWSRAGTTWSSIRRPA